MTNDQLQQFLSCTGSARGFLDRLPLADQIVRWALSDDGPVALADRAAWEIVSSECRCVEIEGVLWWEVKPIVPDLAADDDEVAELEEIAQAHRYLAARQLLEQHPVHLSLVRRPE